MSKKTKTKKKLRAADARQPAKKPVVEVSVSQRCSCDCFEIQVGSTAIWRFKGHPPETFKPETRILLHHCDDLDWCAEYCWE